jgi:hypothetical protein
MTSSVPSASRSTCRSVGELVVDAGLERALAVDVELGRDLLGGLADDGAVVVRRGQPRGTGAPSASAGSRSSPAIVPAQSSHASAAAAHRVGRLGRVPAGLPSAAGSRRRAGPSSRPGACSSGAAGTPAFGLLVGDPGVEVVGAVDGREERLPVLGQASSIAAKTPRRDGRTRPRRRARSRRCRRGPGRRADTRRRASRRSPRS